MIKTLLKSVREYKIYAILAPIFIAGEVIVECFIPYVTVKFVSILNAVPEGQKLYNTNRFNGYTMKKAGK